MVVIDATRCVSIHCYWPVLDGLLSLFEWWPQTNVLGRCLSHSHDLAFQISWLSIIEIGRFNRPMAHPSQMISHFDYASIVTRLLYWFHRQLRPFFCLLKSNFALPKKTGSFAHPPVQVVRPGLPPTHYPVRPLIELFRSDAKRLTMAISTAVDVVNADENKNSSSKKINSGWHPPTGSMT